MDDSLVRRIAEDSAVSFPKHKVKNLELLNTLAEEVKGSVNFLSELIPEDYLSDLNDVGYPSILYLVELKVRMEEIYNQPTEAEKACILLEEVIKLSYASVYVKDVSECVWVLLKSRTLLAINEETSVLAKEVVDSKVKEIYEDSIRKEPVEVVEDTNTVETVKERSNSSMVVNSTAVGTAAALTTTAGVTVVKTSAASAVSVVASGVGSIVGVLGGALEVIPLWVVVVTIVIFIAAVVLYVYRSINDDYKETRLKVAYNEEVIPFDMRVEIVRRCDKTMQGLKIYEGMFRKAVMTKRFNLKVYHYFVSIQNNTDYYKLNKKTRNRVDAIVKHLEVLKRGKRR